MSFDSLTFVRRLKSAGFSEAQAEALADANRELMMPDLATKNDITSLRSDLTATRNELLGAIEAQGLRLTIRLGMLIAAAVAILGTLQRLH